MGGILVPFVLLLISVHLSQQVTQEQNTSDYYVAAVVEFSPRVTENNGWLTLKENVEVYVEYIEKAKQQGADIIVFPEDGLTSIKLPEKSGMDSWTTIIPSPSEEHVPCTQNRTGVSEILKLLSCAANKHSIYVVINIAEKEYCEPDSNQAKPSANTTRYHNTNVVLDRTGKIIARYRKVHLYMEEQFDTVEPPEIVTFDTDFGVKFGTFICFDILFSVPALNLTRIENVTNIVYSTAWFSEAPFLTAAQTQYGWSYAEDVNLLAAGYNRPEAGSTGTGIYLGRNGIANAIMTHQSGNRLLVSRVPKTTGLRKIRLEQTQQNSPGSPDALDNCYKTTNKGDMIKGIYVMRDNIGQFVSVRLNESSSINKTICHRDFCCNVQVNGTMLDPGAPLQNYRAVVYNGCRFYGDTVEADIRVCALTQCSNDSIVSCGVVTPSKITFTDIRITATLHDFSSTNMLVMPTVLNSSLLPFEHWTYNEYTANNGTHFTLILSKPTKDLATFGIYIRDFPEYQPNKVTELHVPSIILFAILASSIYLLTNRF